MKSIIKYFPLLFLFPALSLSQLFSQFQSLDQVSSSPVYSIDISDNNQNLVVARNLDAILVYELFNEKFVFKQELTQTTGLVYTVDLTSNGEWLLGVDYNGIGLVYTYNTTINQFQIYETVEVNGDNTSCFSGSLTDDHQWLVLGRHSGNIYIFNYNGSSFTLFQTLFEQMEIIRYIAITNDHLFLVVSIFGFQVRIYKYDGASYVSLQNIVYGDIKQRSIFITDDHEYLTISTVQSGFAQIYKYNENSELFELLVDHDSFSYVSTSQNVYFVSISPTKKWIGVSLNKSQILSGRGLTSENFIQEQTQLPSSFYNKFSQDEKYLFLGFHGLGKAYINCNYQSLGHYLNENSSTCENCSQNCISCINDTFCTQCEDGNYILTSDYFCLYCDLNNNYFVKDNECIYCPLQGCAQCENISFCRECEQSSKLYGISSQGQCCQITQQCHPNNWLFLFLIILVSFVVTSVILARIIYYVKKRKRARRFTDSKTLSIINLRQV